MEIKRHQRIERSKLNDYISNYTTAVLGIQNVGTGVKTWIQTYGSVLCMLLTRSSREMRMQMRNLYHVKRKRLFT